MDEADRLAQRFEEHRVRLRAMAYRMLGSHAEAEDAVQEAWLHLARTDADAVDNLGGWLTTVVGRVCLDLLRAKRSRPEQPVGVHLPDPVLTLDPADEAVQADAVGLALMVVLDTLAPAERLAFVLHDLFAVPFEQVAPIVDRSPTATRQLASRARRRVRETTPVPDALPRQREVVDAFLAAAREGDFAALLAVLDPGVVLRADVGALTTGTTVFHGAENVARQAFSYPQRARYVRPVLVNGTAGLVAVKDGKALGVLAFTVVGGRIVALDILADPARLAGLAVPGEKPVEAREPGR